MEKNHRDQFFWLGQVNKASLVVNLQSGLIDDAQAPNFAKAIDKVLNDGQKEGAARPKTVITFEPLLIKEAGAEITKLHVGRSSQDIHATYRMAMTREDLLMVATDLATVHEKVVQLAKTHRETVIVSYTNGVAAQPTTYGHYLLAFADGLARDMERLQQYYDRLDRSPMGTTVLNGTRWPLNREAMAKHLGFKKLAYNAYDANQIFTTEYGVEAGFIVTNIALHIGCFIEDVMQQYAQPRPWIILQEGGDNTYVSSAMPQKRNPGILNSTRTDCSTLLGQAMGCTLRSHNVPPGMPDGRSSEINNMLKDMSKTLKKFNNILNALKVNKARALEELSFDWTSSQEIADVLMSKYNLAFRVGHHFASQIVGYAKSNNLLPAEFPFDQVKRIYLETVEGHLAPEAFPMTEAEFRDILNPVSIINNRATKGGPQLEEMSVMLQMAKDENKRQVNWINEINHHLQKAEDELNTEFEALLV